MGVAIFFMILLVGLVVFVYVMDDRDKKRKAEEKKEHERALVEQRQQLMQGPTVNIHAEGGVNENIRMAQVKCVQCRASIEDGSKFCKFCGTKVPDDAFRAEIKIDDPARAAAMKDFAKAEKIRAESQATVAKAAAAKERRKEREEKVKRTQRKFLRIFVIICVLAGASILLFGEKDYYLLLLIIGPAAGAALGYSFFV